MLIYFKEKNIILNTNAIKRVDGIANSYAIRVTLKNNIEKEYIDIKDYTVEEFFKLIN